VTAQRQWVIERSRLATILLGVSFVDENFGYVTGAQNGGGALILQTRDGGLNYQRVPLESQPPPAVGMYLSTHAVSHTSAASAGLCGFCFEFSGIQYTNNGNSFQLANDPSPIFPPVIGIQGGSHVVGSRGTFGFVGQFGENYAVAYSGDSGATWRRAPIAYRGSWARYMSMPTENTWYVTCGTWPRKSDSSPRELFEKLSIESFSNETNPTYKFNVHLDGPETSRHLLQSGGYRTAILKTTNAGQTWTTVFERLENDYYLNNVHGATENMCFTVGDGNRGVGLRTVNGGASWQEVMTEPGRNLQMMDVKMVNQREGWIAGAALSQTAFVGYMYHTVDGGNNWVRYDLPSVAPVSISLYATSNGQVGGHGTALTPDGQSSTIVLR